MTCTGNMECILSVIIFFNYPWSISDSSVAVEIMSLISLANEKNTAQAPTPSHTPLI